MANKTTLRRERILGFVLCLIGSTLAIGMAAAAWNSAPTFLHPGQLIEGERFNGTGQQGRQALTLMFAVGIIYRAIRVRIGRSRPS